MKTPIFVRELTEAECARLKTGLRAKTNFEIRRSQIVLASARGETARCMARTLGCDDQTVRNVIHGFNAKGLAILKAGSHRPHHISTTFPADKLAPLQDILHQSPRNFGKDTSLWTLPLLAEVSYREGVAERLVSGEAIRMALKRLDIAWKRAKRWINSPDPAYLVKKNSATG